MQQFTWWPKMQKSKQQRHNDIDGIVQISLLDYLNIKSRGLDKFYPSCCSRYIMITQATQNRNILNYPITLKNLSNGIQIFKMIFNFYFTDVIYFPTIYLTYSHFGFDKNSNAPPPLFRLLLFSSNI